MGRRDLIDAVKLCNCADCGVELLGESMRSMMMRAPYQLGKYRGLNIVAARVDGRPLCLTCQGTHSIRNRNRTHG